MGDARGGPRRAVCIRMLLPGVDMALECDGGIVHLHLDFTGVQNGMSLERLFDLAFDIDADRREGWRRLG